MVYNLLARDAELEMTRLCEAEGIGINVWGALAGGMLSGRFCEYDPSESPPPGVKPYPSVWTPQYFKAVSRFKELAGGRSMSQLVAWTLRQPQVSLIVCGLARAARGKPRGARDVPPTDADFDVCDDIWRRSGRPDDNLCERL
jgi:aryl-alcohol dehydrogenase-like predicted oxidoreductase